MAKVLVVDDDPDARALLRTLLSGLGHTVLLAPNGQAALGVYHQTKPDLIITDLAMPALNGVSLIEQFRALQPDIRIIAISGKGKEELQRARNAGAAAMLRKPIDRVDLVTELTRVLAMRL